MITFAVGDIIDKKYIVDGVCSDRGGMGTVLHVRQIHQTSNFPLVLKFCKLDPMTTDGSEGTQRFRREVKYLLNLNGNSHTVSVSDSNLAYDPPYFVMKFYEEGDLTTLGETIRGDSTFQEATFYRILDCIDQLHDQGIFHRDIKPENFLVDGETIVVSDLGLAKLADAGTTFTKTLGWWGTMGYIPPEYIAEGFRDASAQGDIFMLGKTFYGLSSGRDVMYMSKDGIHPALFYVIQKCCHHEPRYRYRSVAELRQDLVLAFDVMLGRAGKINQVRQLTLEVKSQMESQSTYDSDQFQALLDGVAMLDPNERSEILMEWSRNFYQVLCDESFANSIEAFLDNFYDFAKDAVESWPYAETVASNMATLFQEHSDPTVSSRALEIAIACAIKANRFAAMRTCTAIITSIVDPVLAQQVGAILIHFPGTFVAEIEPSSCRNEIIRNAIRALN